MVCNHENTLTSKGGFKVVPFMKSWETKASLTLRCLVQSPGMFLNIQLSFLVGFVKLITHRHQIFFLVQTLHLCTGRIQDEERGGTWQKISSKHCAKISFQTLISPLNSRWLNYIIALHFIIELVFGSSRLSCHKVIVYGISRYKG